MSDHDCPPGAITSSLRRFSISAERLTFLDRSSSHSSPGGGGKPMWYRRRLRKLSRVAPPASRLSTRLHPSLSRIRLVMSCSLGLPSLLKLGRLILHLISPLHPPLALHYLPEAQSNALNALPPRFCPPLSPSSSHMGILRSVWSGEVDRLWERNIMVATG